MATTRTAVLRPGRRCPRRPARTARASARRPGPGPDRAVEPACRADDALHHRDAEAEGLAGAGLGLADDVLAGEARAGWSGLDRERVVMPAAAAIEMSRGPRIGEGLLGQFVGLFVGGQRGLDSKYSALLSAWMSCSPPTWMLSVFNYIPFIQAPTPPVLNGPATDDGGSGTKRKRGATSGSRSRANNCFPRRPKWQPRRLKIA